MSEGATNPRTALLVVGVIGTGLGGWILYYATRLEFIRQDEILQGAVIGGLGFLTLCVGMGLRFGWALAAGLLVAGGGFVTWYLLEEYQEDREAREALERHLAVGEAFIPVCQGKPLARAAPYLRGVAAPSPIMIVSRSSRGELRPAGANLPEGWMPASVEDGQLVACESTEKDTVDYCSYSGAGGASASLALVRYHLDVVLFEAKTRRELKRWRVSGDPPGKCPKSMSMKSGSHTSRERSGGIPSSEQVFQLLEPWVTGPITR